MKKIITLTSCFLVLQSFAQIEGTWKLAPTGGALAVGPNQGDGSWWSNSPADVTTRACLFDDSITFNANGTMSHYMDGSTWLELWQGAAQDGCGTPVAPHDGTTNAPYSYVYNSTTGELTVNGVGAHVGLAKVVNGAELTSPANAASSITYKLTFSNNDNTMTADINFGPGWWRFVYNRTAAPVLPDPNITFMVDMSDFTGTFTTVTLNGSFNGWCGACNPMNDMGNGIWSLTLPLSLGSIEYKFTLDGWTLFEEFTGTESCIDPVNDGFANRYYQVTADATIPTVCYNSCEACPTGGIDENEALSVQIHPIPAEDLITIEAVSMISHVEVTDLNGKVVSSKEVNDVQTEMNISNLNDGTYVVMIHTSNGVITKKVIKM